MRKAGIPVSVRMAITGYETDEMDRRYGGVYEADIQQAVEQLQVFLRGGDQSSDQEPETEPPGPLIY
jgi:MoaA/NifB/PqqE/SkfB family radical SAM enzyme